MTSEKFEPDQNGTEDMTHTGNGLLLTFLNALCPFVVPGTCIKCAKEVYGANQACQAMGNLYHDSCFTCSACSKCTRRTLEHRPPVICKLKKSKCCFLTREQSVSLLFVHEAHSHLGIIVLCDWCLVSGCARHSSGTQNRTFTEPTPLRNRTLGINSYVVFI